MADKEPLEDEIDESGENLTQQRMGESDEPVDASWRAEDWGETEHTPHEGEEAPSRSEPR
jgi:hypothetical protein